MDISFNQENQKFNYRVCAMIISGNRILAMHDERSPYFYLPGGRVKMGETAEQAVIREVREELHVTLKITRPLWLNQAFFTEDVDGVRYHELCIYFLMDITDTDLQEKGNSFTLTEGKHIHTFEWLELFLSDLFKKRNLQSSGRVHHSYRTRETTSGLMQSTDASLRF